MSANVPPNAAAESPSFEERPWGRFDVLDEGDGWKVKRITVKPGARLSYQSHVHRKEHWMVVAGVAVVTLEGERIVLAPGEVVDIPVGAKHRVSNEGTETLIFIEIQRGPYLGEDDIQRYQDDFGRV